MTRSISLRTAALIGMVAAGCGGSSPVAYPDLTAKMVAAICQTEVRCGSFATTDECIDEVARVFGTNLQELDDVADGIIDFDASRAGQCVDDLASLSCDSVNILDRGSPSSCIAFIKGTVIDGGACFIGADCISGSCGNPQTTPTCTPGACGITPTLVAIGGSCVGANLSCGDFAFCSSTSNTCTAFLAAGATCMSSADCINGLACTNSVCTALPTAGQACNVDDGCASLGLACFVVSNAQTGVCTAYVDVGASCAAAPCKNGSSCVGETMLCVLDDATGAEDDGGQCTSNQQCFSNFCDSTGICAEQMACVGNV